MCNKTENPPLFRALALKELGRADEAQTVLKEMVSTAQNLIDNKDMRTYYGVGSPSPMPFELDIEKHNLLAGYTLKAFALYGEEKYSEAEVCIRKAEAQKAFYIQRGFGLGILRKAGEGIGKKACPARHAAH